MKITILSYNSKGRLQDGCELDLDYGHDHMAVLKNVDLFLSRDENATIKISVGPGIMDMSIDELTAEANRI